MHVYLDAVFYPNIYQKEEIFRQEGWNYHLEQKEGPLTYNGVVYNEMKGAFSSPDEVLDREIMNNLFPDNTYGVESGGNPENIPELSYEEFLDFHRTYYHPSNSYIYLYGNMDMEEKLRFIDEKYLSAFDALDVDSAIKEQAAFSQVKELQIEYPVSESEEEEDNTYLSYNMVVGNAMDSTLGVAFDVLDYALLSAPGAPLKQALLDAGIVRKFMAIIVTVFCSRSSLLWRKVRRHPRRRNLFLLSVIAFRILCEMELTKRLFLRVLIIWSSAIGRPISDSSPRG